MQCSVVIKFTFSITLTVLTLGENETAENLAVDQVVIVSVSTDYYFFHTPQVDTYFQVFPGEESLDSSKKNDKKFALYINTKGLW